MHNRKMMFDIQSPVEMERLRHLPDTHKLLDKG